MAETALDVAEWMVQKVQAEGVLYQDDAVFEIEQRFGTAFVHDNDNGGQSIDRRVLKAFRERTPNLVWDRSERAWRSRLPSDGEGRHAAG